jgi:hypothetical protein
MLFTYIVRCADDTLYVGHTEVAKTNVTIWGLVDFPDLPAIRDD